MIPPPPILCSRYDLSHLWSGLKHLLWIAFLLILTFPALTVSQTKVIPQYKKKILILDTTGLSTEKTQGSLSKAIPKILKTQLESERVMRDFNSKESYYFYTRKEIRQAMKKIKIKKKDLRNPQKVIKLGWILKADLVILTSYSVTGDKVQVQLKVLSVKEERIVINHTSKPLEDAFIALDLFMIKYYTTIEKIPNLPPIDPSKILILDLADESGVSNYHHLSKRLPEIMKDNLLNIRDYRIVSRSRFLEVMKRRKFVNSDLKDRKKALSIARELGAAVIIYGSYKKVGDTIESTLFVVDTNTGKTLFQHKGGNALGLKEINKLTQNFITQESKRPKSVFKNLPKPQALPPFPRKLGLRVGFPIVFGQLKNTVKTKIPYISVFYRNKLFGEKWLYELDFSYFAFKNVNPVLGLINNIPVATTTTAHHFPLTANVLYPVKIADWLKLIPKAGAGYMPVYTVSPNNPGGNGFSSFILIKPGLELDIRLNRRVKIHLENTLLVTAELNGFDISLFYIPSVGISYGF